MKRYDKVIMAGLMIVLIAIVMIQTTPVVQAASDFVTAWLQANAAASSDGASLKVEVSPGDTISADFATTDTVEPVITMSRTSSGTPANGIGGSIDFGIETSAGNVETGARIAAVTSDVTAASEDIGLSFYTMAAGAAAASKTAVGSTGIWTYAGGATLDNVTAATELNITETNIQLTGIIDLESGNVTVNDDSGDYDFVVESDNDTAALKVDAGLDAIVHGAWDAYTIVTTTAQSYSLASTGKAGFFVQTAGEACTFHLMTELLTSPGAGAVFTIKTGDASDLTIDTEGSETINGAATYVLDGTQETVTILSDGTNYHVVGAYLE